MNVTQPFPCLPGYDGPNEGVIAFVHHDVPAEYSSNIMERVKFYDRGGKPDHELETRRRSLVWLDPTNQPWAKLSRPWAELDHQWTEHSHQRYEFYRPGNELYRQGDAAELSRQEAELSRQEAELDLQRDELGRQRAELGRQWAEHEPAILAQIKALVPDLPWDGHQLVFPKEETP